MFGNMTKRHLIDSDQSVWEYLYDAENHLVETKKNGQTENLYIYDGDGNRVARLDANDEGTIFIGNYFEARYPAEEELISPFFDCASEGSYCTYLPIVGNTEVNELFTGKPGVSYYYSGNQRIAMRIGGEAYFLFGDHLGSSSVVMKPNGELVEKAYYLPWGGTRGEETITSTDYGYTGQMREGDIYYYGARWPQVPEAQSKGFDPAIGRFMQADTIVPLNVQGTQAFDRYAYVNNNPMMYVDSSGHFAITTAILIGVGVGAFAGYAGQVIHNLSNDMSFKEALTTDISAGWIVGGAVAGGVLGGAGFTALSHFGIIQATTATTAASSGLCADGDCGNEIRMLTERGLNTIDDVANSEIGQNLARAFTHNSTSQTESIGSFDDYIIVGKNLNYTYFNMPGKVWEILKGLPDIYWKGINAAYMNQQIAAGKEFVTAISDPSRIGQGTLLELNILRHSGYVEKFLSQFHQIFYTQ